MVDVKRKKRYSSQIQNTIDREWVLATSNPELLVFNGKVACLHSFHQIGDKLIIEYQESDYKSFYGTNITHANDFKATSLANTLAVCTILETSDCKVIIGKRSNKLAEGTERWHVPGGTIEYCPNKVNHPFDVMCRELKEELNLDDILSMVCLGFGENMKMHKPEFLLLTKTKLTSKQIEKNMSKAKDFYEHSEIVFIDKNKISDFVQTHNFTEIGTALVKLYEKKNSKINK